MANREFKQMLAEVFRLCGHVSTGPRGVFDQSRARINAPISPPPANSSSAILVKDGMAMGFPQGVRYRSLRSHCTGELFCRKENTRCPRSAPVDMAIGALRMCDSGTGTPLVLQTFHESPV